MAIANVVLRDHGQNAPRDSSRLRALLDPYEPESVADRCGVPAEKIGRLAEEFSAVPSLAVAGGMGAQHDDAHSTAAAAHILNYVAGNVGRTVMFGADRDPAAGSTYRGLADLVSAMRGGQVGALFVHGANPAYSAPQGAGFTEAIGQVGLKVSFSRFMDETSMLADLILPDHDPMEQWNDFEPQAGTYLLQQPAMQPVFDTRQTGDVLLQLAGAIGGAPAARLSAANYKEYLQQRWQQIQRQLRDRSPFEDFWIESLRVGGVHREAPTRPVRVVGTASRVSVTGWSGLGDDFALIAYPSPALFDGRGANRPWLQELPDPVSKIAWSSWVELHPDTAERLGIAEGDVLEVSSAAGSVTAPAFLYPGIGPNVVAMPIGQGHTAFGRYAENRGANVYHLLGSEPTAFDGLSYYTAVTIRNTGEHERLATNAGRSRQMGRGISQSTTLHAITSGEDHPFHIEHAAEVPEHVERVLEEVQEAQRQETERGNYAGEHPRWAMAVDLSRCTGCSACVTACHAENNIPTVGKELVQHGREMSWLRIERYFEGGGNEPVKVELLPMMCQHCGRAPCEPVCPVFAAYHTPDGLNAQIYNRCVGTRYCANNCPYKVRYFNWFDHQHEADAAYAWPDPLQMLLNPDVTVRAKGIMEKCTFCVQRIRSAQNQARLEGRDDLRDGEVQTACQQTCPSEALVFGDLNDPESAVSRLAASERGYHVLEGLNTAPGVTYLKKVRNVAEEA
jgi:molybdopterin-containing oxidoreductase family iron-sulfur binding subunit